MKYYQGKFKPKHPEKYYGDVKNIIYRSSYELKLLLYLDKHPDIIQYSSEELIIPYKSPIDGKIHRYFTDFWIKKRNKDGKIECVVVEVKPKLQTIEPIPQKKLTKKYLNEVKTWVINQAKWNAAEEYCQTKGWKFIIMTEKDLNIKY